METELSEGDPPVAERRSAATGHEDFGDAFDALYSCAYRQAYKLLGDRQEAEDLAQEACARACERWRRLSDPTAWVVRVATNLAFDRFRRLRSATRYARRSPAATPATIDEPHLELHRALPRLPKRQREAVALRYLADFSEAQTAAAMGCSPGTVKGHTARGLRRAAHHARPRRRRGDDMNLFDNLDDPLGPPAGDALGAVLARVQRHRVVRRGAFAAIALVVVVGAGISANALAPHKGKVHIAGNGTTVPAPRPTLPVPGSTDSTAPTTTSPTTSTTSPSTTTTTGPTGQLGPAPWSGPKLTITSSSLGGVGVGMTLEQAQVAAGLTFDGSGDGAYYPTTLPAGFPHLFVRTRPDAKVTCVSAQIAGVPTPQSVATPEGFRLGDTVQRLLAVYGRPLRFVPAPTTGISPRAGYVLAEPNGNLVFEIDNTKTRIFGIAGGGSDLTPSSCSG